MSTVITCLVRIAGSLEALVKELGKEEIATSNDSHEDELLLQVARAEEDLRVARERWDRHRAFLKRIHRPVMSRD